MAVTDLSSYELGTVEASTNIDSMTVDRRFAHELLHTGLNTSGTAETGPVFVKYSTAETLPSITAGGYAATQGMYILISGQRCFVPPGVRHITVEASANTVEISVTRSPNYLGRF